MNNQQNSSIQGVIALNAQASLDLYQWDEIFEGFDIRAIENDPQLASILLDYYGGEFPSERQQGLHYLEAIDLEDPPLYLFNSSTSAPVNEDGSFNFRSLFNSVLHQQKLTQKAESVAIPVHTPASLGIADFIESVID